MTRRIKRHRKLKAVDRNVTDYSTRLLYCYCYLCTDTVISLYRGRFYARCAKNSSLYREYRYIEDRYIGVLSHTFYCNFCRDIAYSSLYRGYRYIEDRCIGVPLYNVSYLYLFFLHYTQWLFVPDLYIDLYLICRIEINDPNQKNILSLSNFYM